MVETSRFCTEISQILYYCMFIAPTEMYKYKVFQYFIVIFKNTKVIEMVLG